MEAIYRREISKPGECESDATDEGLDESRVLHVRTQITETAGGLQRRKIGQVGARQIPLRLCHGKDKSSSKALPRPDWPVDRRSGSPYRRVLWVSYVQGEA